MEHHSLQPIKSAVMHYLGSKKTSEVSDSCWPIYGEAVLLVEETSHMGIVRRSASDDVPVYDNIKKARRASHSLMPSGLHGNNSLDPETCRQLFETYVIAVLLYGLKVILPMKKWTETETEILEKINKKCLK